MKKFALFFGLLFIPTFVFAAPNLTAEITMDIRADTADAAKKEATSTAIRGGVIQILQRYSDRAVVENLVMGRDDSELQNLVSAVSITSEKQSRTAYSAKFTITVDRSAMEKWYADNSVPNFLSAADESKDKTVIYMNFANGLSDWAALNQTIAADGNDYGLSLKTIFGNSATAYVLTNKRYKFTNLCVANGWTVTNQNGVIRITK